MPSAPSVRLVLHLAAPPLPLALLMLLFAALGLYLVSIGKPTVYREWPSGRCRAVLVHGDTHGRCDRMPPVYDTVWVGEEWEGPR